MTIWLKFLPYIAGVLFVLGCGAYLYHAGDVRGAARVQASFDKFVAASDAVVAKAKEDAARREAAAAENNAQIIAGYQSRLDTANSYGSQLAIRLRQYLAQTSSSPVPPTGDTHPTPGTSAPSSDTGIAETIGAVAAECRDNADQLDALIGELKAQLRQVDP